MKSTKVEAAESIRWLREYANDVWDQKAETELDAHNNANRLREVALHFECVLTDLQNAIENYVAPAIERWSF